MLSFIRGAYATALPTTSPPPLGICWVTAFVLRGITVRGKREDQGGNWCFFSAHLIYFSTAFQQSWLWKCNLLLFLWLPLSWTHWELSSTGTQSVLWKGPNPPSPLRQVFWSPSFQMRPLAPVPASWLLWEKILPWWVIQLRSERAEDRTRSQEFSINLLPEPQLSICKIKILEPLILRTACLYYLGAGRLDSFWAKHSTRARS